MKTDMVEFEFDNYQIEYFSLYSYSQPTGTPGYITPTTAAGTSMLGPTITSDQLDGNLK